MSKEHFPNAKKKNRANPDKLQEIREQIAQKGEEQFRLTHLQNQLGNQAVQRLLAQRSADGPTDLDDETAGRINRALGGGQALDGAVQAQMDAAMGQDFSGVRVHTSPEADTLNQDLNAKAFTTGRDIFFRDGAYQPGSSSGQELIAHELTHVVQQSSGAVGGGGGGMTVNAPGDRFEQEADAVAREVVRTGETAAVQRQELREEDELLQQQTMDEALDEEDIPAG